MVLCLSLLIKKLLRLITKTFHCTNKDFELKPRKQCRRCETADTDECSPAIACSLSSFGGGALEAAAEKL